MRGRLGAIALASMMAFGVTATIGVASAGAAGGNGGACSIAGNPATGPNPGVEIRSHQPFGGDNNPGFAGPGFSAVCRPR